VSLLASIPSPHTSVIDVGPFVIHMYGVMLLVAIAACIVLTGIRWKRVGGDWDLVLRVAVWGVAAGIVGARAYHVITSWSEVPHTWWGPFAVWKGGLGVWGGILCGTIAGAIVVYRSKQSVFLFMDAIAPGLLLAQGIGRWGNYFNQELFGKPSDLPWAVEIGFSHRPAGYQQFGTFHPTFLYEFVWDLLMVGLLIFIGWRFRIKPPGLFALYVSLYTAFRAYEETLRIDPAHHFLGQRINFWVSVVIFAISTGFFVYWQFFRKDEGEPRVARPTREVPAGPAMAVPKGRVRRGR
jgi:phosphatidylglycerol---prolipoprotein diacylglyceryl transferase